MYRANLKAAIVDAYGSQAEFAKKVNIHESTISRIIKGIYNPSRLEREVICAELNMSEKDLFHMPRRRRVA